MISALAMLVALVLCLQYSACVALYHANPRRTHVETLANSEPIRRGSKLAAWAALVASVFLSASLQGWERGVPIWFCLIGVAGFASLYVSAYAPSKHMKSGVSALVAAVLLSIFI